MPELPEVETIVRQLRRALRGKHIVGFELPSGKLPLAVDKSRFPDGPLGMKCLTASRSGKSILLRLAPRGSLVFHLGMSGKMLLSPPATAQPAHTHIVCEFAGGSRLFFSDPRRFGSVHLLDEDALRSLLNDRASGIEPLSRRFTLRRFKHLLIGGACIKSFLLNQHKIAGIGNIYASECLFRAGIHPQRTIDSLSSAEVTALFYAIQHILREAVSNGGTSVSDFCDLYGQPGRHQRHLRVYGRSQEPCRICGTPISVLRFAGRASFFCGSCQPAGVPTT